MNEWMNEITKDKVTVCKDEQTCEWKVIPGRKIEGFSCDFVNLCLCKIHCRLWLYSIFGEKFPKKRTAW